VGKLDELERVHRNGIRIVDNHQAAFLKRLEGLYDDIERDLIRLLDDYVATGKTKKVNIEFALEAKNNLNQIFVDSGYYDAVGDYLNGYKEIIDNIKKQYGIFDYKLKFDDVTRESIIQLQQFDLDFFYQLADEAMDSVYKGLYRNTLTELSFSETVDEIRNALDGTRLEKYAYTYANDAIMRFNRTVNNVVAEKTGWDHYYYAGPSDGKTRPFCTVHVFQVLTKSEILKLDNGQTGNVFTDGGGYNCRHGWIAVPPGFKGKKEA
jgi:hypothetical protein